MCFFVNWLLRIFENQKLTGGQPTTEQYKVMKNKTVMNSHKELQTVLVAAFAMGIQVKKGFFIRWEGSDKDDYIYIQLWRSATSPIAGDAVCLHYLPINRDSVEMNDIRLFNIAKHIEQLAYPFIIQCKEIIDGTPEKVNEPGHKTESPFVASFTMYEIPPFEDEDKSSSEDVLIDVDGYRKNFVIGYYSHNDHEWKNSETLIAFEWKDFEHARWFKLPIAKNDKPGLFETLGNALKP